MVDTSGSDRKLSPKEEERQRMMDERVANRLLVGIYRKSRRKMHARMRFGQSAPAVGKLVIFVLSLLIAGGILMVGMSYKYRSSSI